MGDATTHFSLLKPEPIWWIYYGYLLLLESNRIHEIWPKLLTIVNRNLVFLTNIFVSSFKSQESDQHVKY